MQGGGYPSSGNSTGSSGQQWGGWQQPSAAMYGGTTPWINPNVGPFTGAAQNYTPQASQVQPQQPLPPAISAQTPTTSPSLPPAGIPAPAAQNNTFDLSQLNQIAGLPMTNSAPNNAVPSTGLPVAQPSAATPSSTAMPATFQWMGGTYNKPQGTDYSQWLTVNPGLNHTDSFNAYQQYLAGQQQ